MIKQEGKHESENKMITKEKRRVHITDDDFKAARKACARQNKNAAGIRWVKYEEITDTINFRHWYIPVLFDNEKEILWVIVRSGKENSQCLI